MNNPTASSWFREKGPYVVCFAIVALLHLYFITYGSFHILGVEQRNIAFDSLAKNLMQGEASVEASTIDWEGFENNGKVFIHYGIVPALVRIPLNALWPSGYGQWGRLSCLIGSLLAILAITWMSRLALDRNEKLEPQERRFLLCCVITGAGLGTPLLYLISSGRIYHEAIIWGACLSFWATAITFRMIAFRDDGADKYLLPLALCSTLVLNTRPTMAPPFFLCFGFLFLDFAMRRTSLARFSSRPAAEIPSFGKYAGLLASSAAVFLLGAAVQLWYNTARFGSPLSFVDFSGNYLKPDSFGGTFNIARIPSVLFNYLGINPGTITSSFPWFRVARAEYANPALFFTWRETVISLPIASSWLVLCAMFGLFIAGKKLRCRFDWITAACGLSILSGLIPILTFYFVTQRYITELMPPMIFFMGFFLAAYRPVRLLLVPSRLWLALLVFLSCWITLSSTLYWNIFHNSDMIPDEYRAKLAAAFFTSLDSRKHTFRLAADSRAECRTVDEIDLENGDSESAHALTEFYSETATYGHNYHTKVLDYVAPIGTAMKDDGRRVFHRLEWRMNGIDPSGDAVLIIRHDGSGDAWYELSVNKGHQPVEAHFPPTEPDQWNEAVYRIPRDFLVAGTNSFALTREKKTAEDNELYYIWLLQKCG